MKNINDEYYIMLPDFRKKDRVSVHQTDESEVEFDVELYKPICYEINSSVWKKGIEPADIVYPYHELLIKDDLKEAYFYKYNGDQVRLNRAYIVSPDKREFFEGYWSLVVRETSKDWLNVEESEMARWEDPDEYDSPYFDIRKIQLNSELLSTIPLEKRLCFTFDICDYRFGYYFFHKDMVKVLAKAKNRDVVFVPVSDYKSSWAVDLGESSTIYANAI